MDISDTLAPNSDQLDAIDLIGNPRTFTITDVSKGNPEQPVQIHLAEFPRVWRPGKSMRRVLAACWGTDATVYIGRRVTLFCDESVRFGNDVVGGTRISHLSHIDKPRSIPLLVSRKKSAMFRVDPLPDAPTPPRADPNLLDTGSDLAKRMYAAIKDSDIPQAEVMVWISNVIGRDVDETKQMTPDEASQVIAALGGGAA